MPLQFDQQNYCIFIVIYVLHHLCSVIAARKWRLQGNQYFGHVPDCEGFTLVVPFKLCPRILIDITKVNLSTNVLGFNIFMPIMVAPTAMQRMANRDGKFPIANATFKANTIILFPVIVRLFVQSLETKLVL
uniref:FMN-dependent dehydrogenase domain-containing protein n=1 Tax=Physcomitrium patens TaxID=3218 RepID=A0A2K1JCY7_PHYPA|nr:hypothetical protein PHYPA_019672 [Physcomitrium patens]